MTIGYILVTAGGLVSFVCGIMVLVKMFKTQESPLMGILGIVTCNLWTFIWGWMNAGKYALSKVMLLWTVSILLSMVGSGLIFKAGMDALKESGEESQPTTIGAPVESSSTPAEEPAEEAAPEQ